MNRYWQLLARYLRPQWPRMVLLALVLGGTIAVQVCTPLVAGRFIDRATSGGARRGLGTLALVTMGLALVAQGMAVAETYFAEHVSWSATNALRADLLAPVLGLDLRFHSARTPGELIQRVDGDVAALANFFSQFVVRVLGSLLLIVGIVALLLRDDWRLGLAMLALALIGALALYRLQGFAVPIMKSHRQSFAMLSGFWEERLLGTEDLRGIGALPFTMRRHAAPLGAH
ncbi:helicase, partial [Kouleothrix aurantiaca]